MEGPLLIVLFFGLLIATVRDVQTREVPDLVSFGLIVTGLLGGLLLALIYQDIWIFLEHAFGFLAGAVLGLIMFFGRQWGGGDAKLIMGTGAVLGLSLTNFRFFEFVILLVFLGALYGLFFTLFLAIRHRKRFVPAFVQQLRTKNVHRVRLGLVATAIIVLALFIMSDPQLRILLGLFLLGLYLLVYSWIFIRAIEQSVMIKPYPVSKLTEGDWLTEDVTHRGKVLVPRSNTGLTKKQLALLQASKVKQVMVKEGIPFVPSFFLAFLALMLITRVLHLDPLAMLFS